MYGHAMARSGNLQYPAISAWERTPTRKRQRFCCWPGPVDRGPVQVVDMTRQPRVEEGWWIPASKLYQLINDPDTVVVAHHAMFDRVVLIEALGLDIPIPQWRCSMAHAQAHALPAALAQLVRYWDCVKIRASCRKVRH